MIMTITTWLGAIPPLVIVLVVGGGYLFVLRRWSWPMVLDAVLLAAYYWRPALWPVVAFIGCVRHVPALAREVAVLLQLHTFDGWTLQIVLFLLPALRHYTRGGTPEKAPVADLPPMVDAKPAPLAPVPAEDLPLLANEWLQALNGDPTTPHVGVIGATRLGKTTFVGVLLAYRQSDLVIATPKAAQYDPWFGAEVARPIIHGVEMSYQPIEQAVSAVYREMLKRNAPGGSATPAITLVIDEWPQVVGELPNLAKKVINLLRMGAGCGIRLILMATDVNVRGWRMDGVAGVLDNLIFAKVENERKWSIGRLDANWRLLSPRRLDTAQVWGLAQRVTLTSRGWAGVRMWQALEAAPGGGADGLLGRLLADVGGGVLAGVGVSVGVGGSGGDFGVQTNKQTQTNAQTEATQRIALYRQWRAAGIKREQGRLIRQSQGEGLDDKEWAEAGKEPS